MVCPPPPPFFFQFTFIEYCTVQSLDVYTTVLGPPQAQIGQPIPYSFEVCATNTTGLFIGGKTIQVYINPTPDPGMITPVYGTTKFIIEDQILTSCRAPV